MSLREFIHHYGYLAIFIGTFLEGESILVLGGFAAYLGRLSLPWVMVSAFAGSFGGDQLYFYLGRHFGPRIISRRLSWQAGAQKVYALLRRHQDFLILTFRFYYGLRNVTPFIIGAAQVPRARFLVLNAAGAVVWAIALAYLGFAFGEAIRLVLRNLMHYELLAFAALALAGITIWLVTLLRYRRRARARVAAAAEAKARLPR